MDLKSLICTKQGNSHNPAGKMYGFIGKDPILNAQKIYTGRAFHRLNLKASPLGNPYRVANHSLREHQNAVAAYQSWFNTEMQSQSSLMWQEIDRIADLLLTGQKIVLTCFCPAHLPCHARNVIQPAVVKQAIAKRHK
jgi:Domain of unknown function (DUF4326)